MHILCLAQSSSSSPPAVCRLLSCFVMMMMSPANLTQLGALVLNENNLHCTIIKQDSSLELSPVCVCVCVCVCACVCMCVIASQCVRPLSHSVSTVCCCLFVTVFYFYNGHFTWFSTYTMNTLQRSLAFSESKNSGILILLIKHNNPLKFYSTRDRKSMHLAKK